LSDHLPVIADLRPGRA